MKNYYEILQILPASTPVEIKDSFRFLLFRYHPDHNKGREDWAVQRTMELVEAYHVLTNAMSRAHYDVLRSVRIRDEVPKKGFSLFGGKGKGGAEAAEPLMKEGVEAFKADEYEKAIMAFRRAYEVAPDYPHIRFNVAAGYLAIDRVPESLQWLTDHIAKNKEDADARALYGRIAALAQKRGKAQG